MADIRGSALTSDFLQKGAFCLSTLDIDAPASWGDTPRVYADISFSPSPTLWIIVAVIVLGAVAGWFWVRRSRKSRGPSARAAVFSLLGNVTETALPPGWTDEQIIVLLGDVKLDLRNRHHGDGAILRVFHLAGDVQLRVPPGTRVTTSGSSLLGDHRVDVQAGEGPVIEVRAWGIFGDVKVRDE